MRPRTSGAYGQDFRANFGVRIFSFLHPQRLISAWGRPLPSTTVSTENTSTWPDSALNFARKSSFRLVKLASRNHHGVFDGGDHHRRLDMLLRLSISIVGKEDSPFPVPKIPPPSWPFESSPRVFPPLVLPCPSTPCGLFLPRIPSTALQKTWPRPVGSFVVIFARRPVKRSKIPGLFKRAIHSWRTDFQDIARPGYQFLDIQNHAQLLADPLQSA